MSGFEVVAGQIRTAATQVQAAADGVEDADPSSDIGEVASALPGSQSAGAAATLVDVWRRRFTGWHDDAQAHAANLTASADSYDASDQQAAGRLQSPGTATGRAAG